MKACPFCNLDLLPTQRINMRNDHCLFLQLVEFRTKRDVIKGAGVIVPIKHKETVFDLSSKEWSATFSLLKQAKAYIDERYKPNGYNVGWNCEEVAGQHIPHAHLHVLPRYEGEPLAGKGIRYMFKTTLSSD
ncbi:HIT family protein [Alteribacter aurantiacus]|uniref:HIT family protein n=1 Tax=Alteribacter aurantiacus TaxID=254410 RepID=UPI00047E8D46|nr:HIT family protein [Alteribacter aurantiacus]